MDPKDYEDYQKNNVNELGKVPIMMYHGIHHKNNSDTEYIGGNVDKGGYQRTTEAFINDLEFYYKNKATTYAKTPLCLVLDEIVDFTVNTT